MNKLSRIELIALVEKLHSDEGTEQQDAEWLDLVCKNVPHPQIGRLLRSELCAEEIIDRALAYQPVPLGPSSLESSDG